MPFSASAKFRIRGGEKTKYLHVYAWKKVLTVDAIDGGGKKGATPFPTDDALRAAFVAACEDAEADGWTEYGPKDTWRDRIRGTAPKRPTQKAAEERFDAISDQLAAALVAAAGKRAAEKKAIDAALAAYGDLKELLDGNRLENAIHFFAVDGIGLKKKRKPALLRAEVDEKTAARWLALLEAAASP